MFFYALTRAGRWGLAVVSVSENHVWSLLLHEVILYIVGEPEIQKLRKSGQKVAEF